MYAMAWAKNLPSTEFRVYDITLYVSLIWKRTGLTATVAEIYNSFFQTEICLYILQIYNIRGRKQNDAVQYKLKKIINWNQLQMCQK
jgi:hypothetical protein